LASDEAVVTCVVKNGEFYLENFVEHHSEMGFRHIFFLDNGSTDNTVSLAQRYKNVSVCTSHLPIEANQGLFKTFLARTCSEGGCCLDADIDEFFDYPFSAKVCFRNFLRYLNQNGSSAVLTQLLDMFSDQPLARLPVTPGQCLREVYKFYDLSDVSPVDYSTADLAHKFGRDNQITNAETALYFGGIRKTLYGNDCLLTKHSLFRPQDVELFPHVHFMNRARLADVSCIMRHYKLTSTALELAEQNKDGFVGNGKGYRDFIQFLSTHPDSAIETQHPVRFERTEDLLAFGFVFLLQQLQRLRISTGSLIAVLG